MEDPSSEASPVTPDSTGFASLCRTDRRARSELQVVENSRTLLNLGQVVAPAQDAASQVLRIDAKLLEEGRVAVGVDPVGERILGLVGALGASCSLISLRTDSLSISTSCSFPWVSLGLPRLPPA